MAQSVNEHPFYRPLWVRLVVTAVAGGWLAFEALVSADAMWIVIAAAAFLYCIWSFFIAWKPVEPPAP